jgi:hypothetical protein
MLINPHRVIATRVPLKPVAKRRAAAKPRMRDRLRIGNVR